MKAIKARLEEQKSEDVADFEKKAAAFAKKIIANYKDYEFVSFERASAITATLHKRVIVVHRREHES
jgi:uncharacterized membrane-anchored protein YhcB (DUF1043 family)